MKNARQIISRLFTRNARKTFYATLCVAGQTIRVPVDAPTYQHARATAETMADDCGWVLCLDYADA